MSWLSNQFLQSCSGLSFEKIGRKPQVGDLIGRGFADLGFEVFHLLPSNRLLSLFTGDISPVPDNMEGSLFLVPDVDSTVEILIEKQVDLTRVEMLEDSSWLVEYEHAGLTGSVNKISLATALITTLSEVLE